DFQVLSTAADSVVPAPPRHPAGLLYDDAWLEFNRQKWGVTPERVRFATEPDGRPAVEVVYYLDRRGRIWKPPTNTYLPVHFVPTATQALGRLDRQWQSVSELLAADMRKRGLANDAALPPDITDVRAWQWAAL